MTLQTMLTGEALTSSPSRGELLVAIDVIARDFQTTREAVLGPSPRDPELSARLAALCFLYRRYPSVRISRLGRLFAREPSWASQAVAETIGRSR